ncbi:hypothetical protein BH24ACT5_BH24ACT5_17660 [soil metagenome]
MAEHEFGVDFGYVVKQTQQAYRSRMDRALGAFGLSTPQYVVLAALDHLGATSNAELARACFVTPQSMHSIVATLERRALIRRPPVPDTGRALRATLTDDGRSLLDQAADVVQGVDDTGIDGIDERDLSTALDVLRHITDNLRDP